MKETMRTTACRHETLRKMMVMVGALSLSSGDRSESVREKSSLLFRTRRPPDTDSMTSWP